LDLSTRRRAIARFEPHFSRDFARWADAVAAGAIGLELLRRFNPQLAARVADDEAALIVEHLAEEFRAARTLRELAGGGP